MAKKKKLSLSTPTSTPKTRRNRVSASFVISVIVHVLVLSIPVASEVVKARGAPTLEVVLVNARSAKAPKDPQMLAQANIDGGGNSDEDVHATTPLPPQDNTRAGDDLIDRKRGQQANIQQRPEEQEVLTQEHSTVAVDKTRPTPDKKTAQKTASGDDTADATAMALQLQAAIDRRTQEYNQRPRRHSIGARAKEERFALYVESWRLKTERIGELNYPAAARGRIYGALVMTVSIRKNGSVEKIVINKSSGHKVLDDAARRIVSLGDPYAEFPPNIARDTDVLDITRTWTFTNENKLRTSNK